MNLVTLDSKNVDFSSHHSSTYKDGTWNVNFQNLPSLKQTLKIFPSRVGVANSVPNVNGHSGAFKIVRTINNGAVRLIEEDVQLPVKQYDITTLVAALNQYSNTRLLWAYDSSSGKMSVTTGAVGTVTLLIEAKLDFFELIGFSGPALIGVDETQFVHDLALGSGPNQTSVGDGVVNLSGTSVFHIVAHGKTPNAMESANGESHDVLFTGLFGSDTPYGHYKAFEANDRRVDEISYRQPMNLSAVRLSVVDSRMRPLPIPVNYPVHLVCRCYHSDTGGA